MNLFEPMRSRNSMPQSNCDNSAENAKSSHTITAQIGYRRLEQRQVLSASFIGAAGGIVLDSFDPGQDLLFVQTDALINGVVQDSYLFEVSSGGWTGSTANPLIDLESVNGGVNNRLEVATALFGGAANAQISIDGTASGGGEVEFQQAGNPVTFQQLDISNFTNQDSSLSLNSIGDITAANISVVDSNPLDAIDPLANLTITTQGSITTAGSIDNLIDNLDNEVRLIATGQNNDITIGDRVETQSGSIIIQAGDSVRLASTSQIMSGGMGDVLIDSGQSPTQGDSGDVISMADGSTIDVGFGVANLTAQGNVLVGEINSLGNGDAVSIETGGQIIDSTAAESDNITTPNGRAKLIATGDIGAAGNGDIDIESQLLEFDTDGLAFVSDSDNGITVDRVSRADGGATVTSNGQLTISQDINLGDDSSFTSNNSSSINDDIVIDSGAVVTLNSATSSQLSLIAADDIVFDTGAIVTTGGNHSAVLIADNEGAIDSDRGSISNTAAGNTTISTTALTLVSHDGIGDLAPLRTNVDAVVGSNLGTGNIRIDEATAIDLDSIQTVDGAIVVNAVGDIQATNVNSGETETAEDNIDNVELVSTLGSINVSNINSTDELLLSAFGTITDDSNSQLVSGSNASFSAGASIELADSSGDILQIAGNASFAAATINIGLDSQTAGTIAPAAATVELGSVTVNATTATVVEDDSTLLAGSSSFDDLYLVSADQITNQSGAALSVTGHAQFSTPDEIVLGNQANDTIDIATAGFATNNVHIETDSDLIIDGSVPDQSASAIGTPGSRGTTVDQTLFVTSTGSVNQSLGALDAANIGIEAAGHVHLANVSFSNQAVAVSAGVAGPLTDANLIQELGTLASVENSEVNAQLDQSIALKHQGTLNSTTVSSHLGTNTVSGLTATDGSVFASAVQDVNLIDSISANSSTDDPQATVYSESGSAATPGVQFVGGTIEVNGPTNTGLVNANQTIANFFDANGDPLSGTTTILLLNTDGTADQDIVAEYGHTGETGYRVGIVWDSENQPGQPVETINTFVSDPLVASEAFEDTIYQNNPNTFLQIGGNEGGQETFSKVQRYSKDAIILHQDQPNVFSEVTVRNDQDINLFTGTLASVTNSLNETSQVLRAELDSPKGFAPDLPTINQINEIPIRPSVEVPLSSSNPDSSSGFTFTRDVQPFESGDLKWVQVQIPISELEEIDGEVRLKDPTKVFGKTEDAELNELDDEIGENEVEKIIEVIETDEKSEGGYWYKVFKDYRNRDDELFFYHFKTGEPQETESLDNESSDDTNSDLQGDNSEPDANQDMQEFESQQIETLSNPFDARPAEINEPETGNPQNEFGPPQTQEGLETNSSISPGSLLMASLLLKKLNGRKIQCPESSAESAAESSARSSTENYQTSESPKLPIEDSSENPNPTNIFSRSSRLKRRIRKLLDAGRATRTEAS